MADTASLGARLRAWRKAKPLTQMEVAALVGRPQSSISAAESGALTVNMLARLVSVYDPPPDEVREAMREAAGLPDLDPEPVADGPDRQAV